MNGQMAAGRTMQTASVRTYIRMEMMEGDLQIIPHRNFISQTTKKPQSDIPPIRINIKQVLSLYNLIPFSRYTGIYSSELKKR